MQVSTLVTHTATSQDSTLQVLPNQLITGSSLDPLSTCSLPSLSSQLPVTPVSLPSAQSSNSGSIYPPPIQATSTAPPTRVFEVENVPEDKPDSPDISDVSASGSTENLGKETQRSNSQDSNPPVNPASKSFTVQSVPSLESKSDSYIGREQIMTDISTSKPLDQAPANPQAQPPPERSKSPRHYSLPNIPPNRTTRLPVHSRIPEHYCTTSILDTAPTWQRGGITEETYVPPVYRRHNTSSSIQSYPTYPSSEGDAVEYEALPPPGEHPFNIDELPQASLLSEAFMRFMHSMSMVFRDPTFQPLMVSLDRRFGSQQLTEPGSAPPITQHRTAQHESIISRSVTDPGAVPPPGGETDEELRIALEG